MGLFDKMFDSGEKRSRDLGPSEAFMGILLAASASDGHVADEELGGLITMCVRMRMFEEWNQNRFGTVWDRFAGVIKRHGVERLLHRCIEALPAKMHETAFACACDIVLADGIVEEEEKEFMEDLQRLLDISGDQALTIVEVMMIKNRG